MAERTADNDRIPHTHGGVDAPECTPYGISCRTDEHEHVWVLDVLGGGLLCRVCRTRVTPPASNRRSIMHELETPWREHDAAGECCRLAALGEETP